MLFYPYYFEWDFWILLRVVCIKVKQWLFSLYLICDLGIDLRQILRNAFLLKRCDDINWLFFFLSNFRLLYWIMGNIWHNGLLLHQCDRFLVQCTGNMSKFHLLFLLDSKARYIPIKFNMVSNEYIKQQNVTQHIV